MKKVASLEILWVLGFLFWSVTKSLEVQFKHENILKYPTT